jgi:cytochrome c-type biogenesis protein CcsB
MSGTLSFTAALVLYLATFFVDLVSLLFARDWHRLELAVLLLGFVFHSVGILLRGIAISTVPVTNTYETLVSYAWVFVLAYLVFGLFSRWSSLQLRPIGMFSAISAFAVLTLAASPLFSSDPRPLIPALRGIWLPLHVGFTVMGEGFFAMAFFASSLFLVRFYTRTPKREASAALEALDLISYRAIALGFPLFTLGGLLFGSIWAQQAWGSYWSWDPKETFMLVTWLVYVVYLHVRVRGDEIRVRAAWIAVAGFLLAIFTFAGVNFLLSGLHSYR